MRGGLDSSSIFRTGTRYKLEIVHQSVKRIKLKVRRFLGPFVEVTGEKLVGGAFLPPILKRVNCISARSVPQKLSVNEEYTLHFSSFLRIGL